MDRNVMVPWFTIEPTVPVITLAVSPTGAFARTVNVSESAAETVPVTDAALVEPEMPVTATLTSPDDADTAGALNKGADTDPGVYDRTDALYETDTCHDVSWFVPVRKSNGTTIVSPAKRGL